MGSQFPYQGSDPHPLHWECAVLTEPPGKPMSQPLKVSHTLSPPSHSLHIQGLQVYLQVYCDLPRLSVSTIFKAVSEALWAPVEHCSEIRFLSLFILFFNSFIFINITYVCLTRFGKLRKMQGRKQNDPIPVP